METTTTTNAGATTETVETTEVKETYTKAEMEALLQKESDRRVTEALKKAEKTTAKKISEAEKLAKMSEAEKYEYNLAEREKFIADKERQLSLSENKVTALTIMSEKGIPSTLIDFIVTEDADEMMSNINLFQAEIAKAVRLEVSKRMASGNPKKGIGSDASITKETFNKMSVTEMTKLSVENPELFNRLVSER